MASRFDVAKAAQNISGLLASERAKVSRDALREQVLRILIDDGRFERARFYESCADVVSDGDEILVLVTAVGEEGDIDASNVGLCVPGAEGPLGADKAAEDPVARHTIADFDRVPEWLTNLGLEDRTWADVHLRVSGQSVGAVVVDWHGEPNDLTATERLLLAGIGTLVAQHIQLRPLDRLTAFRVTIERSPEQMGSPEETPLKRLLSDALPEIAGLLDCRVAALFEYRWSSGRLAKTLEWDTHLKREIWDPGRILVLDESYELGESLTGKAWDDPLYRVVPSLERLSAYVPDLIDEDSNLQHTRYMGEPPSTCLYGRIDSMETRYMIRLMNRGDGRSPYAGERELLRAMLEELRTAVDKASALGRTASLERATRIAAQTTDPHEMLDALGPLFAVEDVSDALVWCHRAQSDQFSFRAIHGDALRSSRPGETPGGFVEWRSDALYKYLCARGQDVDVINAGVLRRAGPARSPLYAQIRRHEHAAGVLMIKLSAGDTTGLLLIPLRQGSSVQRGSVINECGVGRLSLLRAYGSLLADVIDGSVARARADGARRALGVLGHELSTPLARLGNAAEQALDEIHAAAVDADSVTESDTVALQAAIDDMRSATVAYGDRIRAERRSIGAAMSLAPLVAQESADGHLELQMRKCDLAEMVIRATTQAAQEAGDQLAKPTKGPSLTYNFRRSEAVLGLGEIVGDESFLFLALLNVLRNAYKYSVPPGESTVCRIDVTGMRQRGMKIVVVSNVGREIDPDMVDRIFEPWVRLKDDRDNTARTGMGIGLFFARRIALAHGGTVICTGSDLVAESGSGPGRSQQQVELARMIQRAGVGDRGGRGIESATGETGINDGQARFLTKFEIRVSDKLEEGAYVHEWSPGYVGARTRRRSSS
jgi:signal transduction histidine kinase